MNKLELNQFMLDSSKTNNFINWEQAVEYCLKYPGQWFVHSQLTLYFKHGMFSVDTIGRCQKINSSEILSFLEENYPFFLI